MSKAPSRSQDQFIIRLPDGMRERIKAEADKNGRSMNAEIVALLERHYPTLPTLQELLEGSDRMAFSLSEIIEKQQGEMDMDTRRAARSFLESLRRLKDRLPTENSKN